MNTPVIRVLEPHDHAALEAFLRSRVESSMFLISNMRSAGLADHGQAYGGTYAAAFEGGKIIAVVAHYWNENMILQAPAHVGALCRAAVEGSKRPLGGFIGPCDQVSAAQEALGIAGANIQMDETEKLYTLGLDDLREPDDLRSGKVSGRRIESRDLDLITEWRIAYSLETLGQEDSSQWQARCRRSAERSLKEGRTWVLEVEGVPVACTSFNAAIGEVVQVGGVWTPPELRRRGYGRSIVAVSLLDARSEGVETAILFTGETNIGAQKAYAALGFRHIGDYRMLFLRSPL